VNRIEIAAEGISLPPWTSAAESFALKVLDSLGRDGWDLSLAFCGDEEIRRFNAEYRGKDESTDVLSFELGETVDEGEGQERYLAGDILISLDTLAANARYFEVSEDEELRRLLVHGILHLDGMDHETNDPGEPMLVLQEKILSGLDGERILP